MDGTNSTHTVRSSLLIAEVAQAHEGSMAIAHGYIDAIADAGAGAVKFQLHLPEYESTEEESFRKNALFYDSSRYEYWERVSFSEKEWFELRRHARERGLLFGISPFSVEAVNRAVDVGADFLKLGSGELLARSTRQRAIEADLPLFFSTGLARTDELELFVAEAKPQVRSLTLLYCVSKYPTPLEEVNLLEMSQLSAHYGLPAGLSDHSGTPWPALGAISAGASAIEVHVVFDRRQQSPDSSSSLEFSELELVANFAVAWQSLASSENPHERDEAGLIAMRQTFGKSLAPTGKIRKGQEIREIDLCEKKPGTGISYTDAAKVVGRAAARDLSPNRLLRWEDLE